jgi:hypothetical protein
MKACRESSSRAPLILKVRWKSLVNYKPQELYPQGKNAATKWTRSWARPRDRLDAFWEERNILPLPGFEPPDRPVRSLVVTPTTSPQLHSVSLYLPYTFKVHWFIYVASGWTFCPHSVFMCFIRSLEQTAIISLYIVNWLVFITETECVYCAVRTESLTFNNSTFCPHCVFMCFIRSLEQTAIISLYSVNWLVFITETNWIFNIQQFYVLPTQCIYVFYTVLRTNSDYFPTQH